MDEIDVVAVFLRHDAEVLVCRQPLDAEAYPDRWAPVWGHVESDGSPGVAARSAIRGATGLTGPTLVRSGDAVRVEVGECDRTLVVYPFLFEAGSREIGVSDDDEDRATAEWVPPTEILRREIVPELWATYRRVAPSVRSVAADDEHGAAYLSIRGLEVLRDRAGLLAAEGESDRDELDDLGRRLLRARPSMAVLHNRVSRALASAGDDPADVEAAAIDGIDRALAADREAAAWAGSLVDRRRVLTLSRSGTVLTALAGADPVAVFVAESRPAREGIAVAERLAVDLDAPVAVHTDAAVAHVLAEESIDAVLVGADTVLPDGRVVNKTGTRATALAAVHEDVPVYAVAATDKVTTREPVNLESGDATAVYDGDASLDVRNPTFDVTPADAVAGVVTERGVLDAEEVVGVAEELRAFEEW